MTGPSRRVKLACGAFAALMLGGYGLTAQPIGEAMMADADAWPSWGRTGDETHYSPLHEIHTGNISALKLAWHFDLPPNYSPTTPLAAEGKIFFTQGHGHIRALDALTGKLLWEYDSGARDRTTSRFQLSWGNKGVAYWDHKVFVAAADGLLIALDAANGKEIWKTRDFPISEMRTMTGPPRVFAGKVLIGHGGADVSPIQGYVSAYDAETGKLAWRFYTVPNDPSQPATTKAEQVMRPTWKGDWFGKDGVRKAGGGTVWNAMSYDPALNLIYLGVGNGFPYDHLKRSPGGGDNLFLASIVAVNADTGEYVWHYQTCPAEQWDCTSTTDMTLATLKIGGKDRKVLMQAPKNGFFYVIDRTNGQFISARAIAKVTWAKGIDQKTGRPIENPGIRYQGKPGLFELWPGPTGAHSWAPQAYSPQTGLVYVPIIQQGALIGDGTTGGPIQGIGVKLVPEADLPGGRHAFLRAWNPVTQTLAWEKKLPGAWPGGVLATAGGLVFQGRLDRRLMAYDARTGREVWNYPTDAPVQGAPISFRMNGKQYITVITGPGGEGASTRSIGGEAWRTDYRLTRQVLTFAIGGTDGFKPTALPPLAIPADPTFKPDAALAAKGEATFIRCMGCHGNRAVSGGSAPDLRYSPMIVNALAFRQIVKGGALKANGMPPFDDIADTDVEAIRFYLRTRSKLAPAEVAAAIKLVREGK
ncbi:quinohemoprotein ethanol dehydrogenase [Sphingomonas sp. YR710]|uniref:PQQ-dependent dehydrogenase, methanol/ethanol family n=1 Tax=Sphingomonas sp. YR710 TaxID=1882773 RepID=UPI00088736E2|nr:PQQ-dependent dehydrogenase, methanol/ethanol family [Sphingomonas sp. YR710]SDC92798.1 quinohemoprotein ethanol dehydrogenase [Sphingomonas sp. YR710]